MPLIKTGCSESITAHGEGGNLNRVRGSLAAATAMAKSYGNAEVLLADCAVNTPLAILLEKEFPAVRHIFSPDLGNDEIKTLAAHESRGDYILFLDGDCIPDNNSWLHAHLTALQNGASVTSGFTRYDGRFFGAICSVMDFGFLLPAQKRELQCYAFNNSGFRRETILKVPIPNGPIRCRCYGHAQEIKRQKLSLQLVPEAKVRHELQPFFVERFRQGYDAVAACYVDPNLAESRGLKLGIFFVLALYVRNVFLDCKRLQQGRHDLHFSSQQVFLAFPLFALFRLIDLGGMIRAVSGQPSPHQH